jgi:tripartite-type tricarboxylate transporter receptor subunit TctC
MKLDRRHLLALSLAGPLVHLSARAQSSDQVLNLIVPFSPGSSSDILARIFADAMTRATGRSVIVDNKPGAASVIGSLALTRAKPDGATVLFTSGGHITNAALLRKLPYNSVSDFTPITQLLQADGFALVVNATSEFQTLPQLVAAAKANPARYSYGSSGTGGTPHLFGALFAKAEGIDLLHVPFKGQPVTELLGGTVNMIFAPPNLLLPYIQSGKLRVLAVTASKRNPKFPAVPTFRELGIAMQDVPAWSGIFGPRGMSAGVVDALYKDILKTVADPSYREKMLELGAEVVAMPPAEFRVLVVSEIDRFKRILPPLGIQMD